jgi:hypothetical protein
MALACAIVVFGWGEYTQYDGERGFFIAITDLVYQGVMVLVMITAVMLLVSSRLTDAMLPAMLLGVLVTACYNSADKFLSPDFIWVAVPAVAAVVFHFILYRKPLRIGRSFWGLCAVTVAVTLGGVGTITQAEYFSGTALFYVFGLGIGMMLFYLLVKSQSIGDSKEGVARAVYAAGMLAVFCIFWIYYRNWDIFLDQGEFLSPQLGNNVSTFLMLAMPFPLFYASRRYVDVFATLLMYVAAVFSGSRAGLVMGTAEFLFLLVIYAIVYQKGIGGWIRRIFYIGITVGFVVGVVYFLPQLARLSGMAVAEDMTRTEVVKYLYDNFVHSGEARVGLLGRMKLDFFSNPVFGVGIGYTGNSDIYNPVKGAMNWYHMWFAQVIGGLGVVGVLAYGYQLVDRVITFFKNRCYIHFTFLMSYMGLFLMSQVNPGEFCPVPYAMLAVTYFLMMEDPARDIVLKKRPAAATLAETATVDEVGTASVDEAEMESASNTETVPEDDAEIVSVDETETASVDDVETALVDDEETAHVDDIETSLVDEEVNDESDTEKQTICMCFDKGVNNMLTKELLSDFMGKICAVYTVNDMAYYGRITDIKDGWLRIEGEHSLRIVNVEMIKEVNLSVDQTMPPDDSLLRSWKMLRFSLDQYKQLYLKARADWVAKKPERDAKRAAKKKAKKASKDAKKADKIAKKTAEKNVKKTDKVTEKASKKSSKK